MSRSSIEDTPRVPNPIVAETLRQYLLYQRHYFAYETALNLTGSAEIFLDVGCGFGSALELVSRKYKKIIAIDAAESALSSLPAYPNIEKKLEDATNMSLDSNSVDTAVAFQLIEHVNTVKAKKIIQEIRRVLKIGGCGYVTTPNARWRLLPKQRPWNHHHVHEYWPKEIKEFCGDLGISESDIYGVVGLNGAQEVEKARVKQSYLKVWGGKPGRLIDRALAKWSWGRQSEEFTRPPDQADYNRAWFELSSDYQEGLDFWVEIRK